MNQQTERGSNPRVPLQGARLRECLRKRVGVC